jgi:hypothetical protein
LPFHSRHDGVRLKEQTISKHSNSAVQFPYPLCRSEIQPCNRDIRPLHRQIPREIVTSGRAIVRSRRAIVTSGDEIVRSTRKSSGPGAKSSNPAENRQIHTLVDCCAMPELRSQHRRGRRAAWTCGFGWQNLDLTIFKGF